MLTLACILVCSVLAKPPATDLPPVVAERIAEAGYVLDSDRTAGVVMTYYVFVPPKDVGSDAPLATVDHVYLGLASKGEPDAAARRRSQEISYQGSVYVPQQWQSYVLPASDSLRVTIGEQSVSIDTIAEACQVMVTVRSPGPSKGNVILGDTTAEIIDPEDPRIRLADVISRLLVRELSPPQPTGPVHSFVELAKLGIEATYDHEYLTVTLAKGGRQILIGDASAAVNRPGEGHRVGWLSQPARVYPDRINASIEEIEALLQK